MTDLKVYSLAPEDINTFIKLYNSRILKSPKLVVYACIERDLYSLPNVDRKSRLKKNKKHMLDSSDFMKLLFKQRGPTTPFTTNA